MGWFTTAVRRSLWLVLVVAAGGAVWSWRRDTADASTPAAAEWPRLIASERLPPPQAAMPSSRSAPAFVEAAEARSADSDAKAAVADGYRRAKN